MDSTNFQVLIGNGDALRYSRMCANVGIILDGYKFVVDLFVLPLQGADIVLGAQWLATLGPIVMDCKELTLSFTW